MTNLVYMNWRRKDQTPNMTRLAWPGYCLRMLTTAIVLETRKGNFDLAMALGVGLAWIYNRLVRQRNIVSAAWADIDVQLQKRHELVPNLVATVRGYMQHEADVLEQTTLTRRGAPQDLGPLAAQAASQYTAGMVLFCQVFNHSALGLTAPHMQGVSMLPPADLALTLTVRPALAPL